MKTFKKTKRKKPVNVALSPPAYDCEPVRIGGSCRGGEYGVTRPGPSVQPAAASPATDPRQQQCFHGEPLLGLLVSQKVMLRLTKAHLRLEVLLIDRPVYKTG